MPSTQRRVSLCSSPPNDHNYTQAAWRAARLARDNPRQKGEFPDRRAACHIDEAWRACRGTESGQPLGQRAKGADSPLR